MKKIVILVAALALTVAALAQATDQTSAATLAELRAEAQRLTALAQVPEAGRAEAEELLTRFDALMESARAQELTRLQAYIAALRNGDSPSVAQEVAASAISAGAVDIARERAALQSDVQAFLETYPEAVGVFRHAALAGRGVEMLRAGQMGILRAGQMGAGQMGAGQMGAGQLGTAHGFGQERSHMARMRPGGEAARGFGMSMPDGFDGPRWQHFRQGGQSAP